MPAEDCRAQAAHCADIQDRDGASDLIERCRDAYPSLSRFFADGGYAGQKLQNAIAHLDRLAIEIVKRSDTGRFVILPRRWVVERTIAWLNRCRRLAKGWEATIASAEAWLIIASIRRMMDLPRLNGEAFAQRDTVRSNCAGLL